MKNLTITTEFRTDENTAYTYLGKILICSLDFNLDFFTDYENLSQHDADEYYNLMTKEKEECNADNYDVREEQGIFGYGY